MNTTPIERFFLYGEPARPVGERFVHLEYLDDRSRPANWIIRPHAHADMHHVFYVRAGGGWGDADGEKLLVRAPCVVIVPAGVVHGFAWKPESNGRVLTFSSSYLRGIGNRDRSIESPFAAGMWTAAADRALWDKLLDGLARELSWSAPAHDLAIGFSLGALLVQTFRAHHEVKAAARAPVGVQALLVARFRECVEDDFRAKPSIAALARSLGVSVSRLRAACQEISGKSPVAILHERVILEARRLMRYSNMNVSQVAAYLGFSDAAYFSRFFSRETGSSPRAYKNKPLSVRR